MENEENTKEEVIDNKQQPTDENSADYGPREDK